MSSYIICCIGFCVKAQVVTDAQWEARAERFPDQPPKTREYYLLRAIFQKHFPSKSAHNTVPRVRQPVGCPQ